MRCLLVLALLVCGCAAPRVAIDTSPSSAAVAEADVAAGEQLFPVLVEGRWGYIDRAGDLAITPRFDSAMDFAEGRAAARDGDLWGYIAPDGEWVAPPRYQEVGPFANGRGRVAIGEWGERRYGYVGPEGREVVAPTLPFALDFAEGLALVRLTVRPPTLVQRILAKVSLADDRLGLAFLRTDGEVAFEVPGTGGSSFSGGLAPFERGFELFRSTRWGYLDREGQVAVAPDLDGPAFRHSDGLAIVARDGRFGFVDESGAFVIDPTYEMVHPFADGRAPVQTTDGQWGFVDREGTLVVAPQYTAALPFSDGLAAVQTSDGWGYIAPDGTVVVPPGYSRATPFRNGLARVYRGDALFYIDADGATVWPR